ncbi:MAG TPA: TIGR03435 family protein [Bryobacteraceae bacterium]|nr:TIGR03435 family protein [Bryobacteraceae bacterium]
MDQDGSLRYYCKVPSGATMNDVPSMLRDLLEQRFHIQAHHEAREMRAYALLVGKDGARLKAHPMELPVGTSGVVRFQGKDKDGFPAVAPGHVVMARLRQNDRMVLVGGLEPIQALCNALSSELQEPVIDETELTGRYDFRLVYVPTPRGAASQTDDRAAGETVGGASDPGFTIFRAVESQLGLKLEHKKLAVDLLVVDSVDRTPTEN